MELLQQIFNTCIIPLLGILTAYAIKFINAKSAQLDAATDDVTTKKYIMMISDTVTTCVIATNQTYVDTLKKAGTFTAEAQKQALENTLNNVLAILSDEAKKYLTETCGDMNKYLLELIEKTVNEQKG